jgi:hypothetical protein
VESDHGDYRFRAYLDRDTVAGVIADHVAAIDYEHGFKDSTPDRRRLPYLYSVWEIWRRCKMIFFTSGTAHHGD